MSSQLTREVISRWVMPRYWYSKDVAAKTFTVKFVFIDTVILCQGGRLPSRAASHIPALVYQTPLALHRGSRPARPTSCLSICSSIRRWRADLFHSCLGGRHVSYAGCPSSAPVCLLSHLK